MTVVPFREDGVIPPEVASPDESVISELEELLEAAKSGSLRAIGYALVRHDNAITTNWKGKGASQHSLLAAITVLAYRYTADTQD